MIKRVVLATTVLAGIGLSIMPSVAMPLAQLPNAAEKPTIQKVWYHHHRWHHWRRWHHWHHW